MSEHDERREFGRLFQRSGVWYLRYRVGGAEQTESLKTKSRVQAERKAAVIGDHVGKGEHNAPAVRKLVFSRPEQSASESRKQRSNLTLEEMLLNKYEVAGLRSLPRVMRALEHLKAEFKQTRVASITEQRVTEYERKRLASGAARATLNYELAILRRMFRVAGSLVPRPPKITTPNPRNARQGFFEASDFAAVLHELPGYLKAPFHFAYLTGWRIHDEVFSLTWANVDFGAGVVRLEPDTTKNDEGRTFPFRAFKSLAALLERQRTITDDTEHATGKIIPHVFHNCGKRIKDPYAAWRSACDRAAHGGKGKREKARAVVRPSLLERRLVDPVSGKVRVVRPIPHDFRRTAVRNLIRAGVAEQQAMKLTGHVTRSVFDRYDIVNEKDLSASVEKLAAHLDGASKAPASAGGTSGVQPHLKLTGTEQ